MEIGGRIILAIQVAQTIELSNLSSLHEKILYAEKHRKNYDIFFTVKYDSKWTACYIADAIERVMEGHKALGLTIVQQESEYVFCLGETGLIHLEVMFLYGMLN